MPPLLFIRGSMASYGTTNLVGAGFGMLGLIQERGLERTTGLEPATLCLGSRWPSSKTALATAGVPAVGILPKCQYWT